MVRCTARLWRAVAPGAEGFGVTHDSNCLGVECFETRLSTGLRGFERITLGPFVYTAEDMADEIANAKPNRVFPKALRAGKPTLKGNGPVRASESQSKGVKDQNDDD